jgi:hypothetical protein
MFDNFRKPGSIHVIKNIDGELHIFRMNSVKLPTKVNL